MSAAAMGMSWDEIERLASEDPDDRADREAHGFSYEDDWQDENALVPQRMRAELPGDRRGNTATAKGGNERRTVHRLGFSRVQLFVAP